MKNSKFQLYAHFGIWNFSFWNLSQRALNLDFKILEIKKAQLTSCAFLVGNYLVLMYYLISSNVVPCLISPVVKPFLNQYILCSEVP